MKATGDHTTWMCRLISAFIYIIIMPKRIFSCAMINGKDKIIPWLLKYCMILLVVAIFSLSKFNWESTDKFGLTSIFLQKNNQIIVLKVPPSHKFSIIAQSPHEQFKFLSFNPEKQTLKHALRQKIKDFVVFLNQEQTSKPSQGTH